ncbi:hypothetical protein PR002_g21821 [Phytophthora rubi]|uniref:Integrase zinc-binding domain-containing protein n=1 Tax=Phytophthora rubi TaxID=129364 RepID=A0A6A3J4F0_9STRA|nr:hypothetical protein PR002_g21821 [Phytophthora rubi]
MDALDTFGEPPVTVDPPERRDNILDDPRATIDDVAGEVSDDGDTDEDPPLDDEDKTASSPVDAFGLDSERFKEEQRRTPWIQALIAFLESGALALDAQLRVKVLQLAPRYVVRNGTLMRRVQLRARAGPARSISVPVVPLPFIETVPHYCHSDVFSAHVGQTKTMDKVRKHAY